jgi:hypothetical protein
MKYWNLIFILYLIFSFHLNIFSQKKNNSNFLTESSSFDKIYNTELNNKAYRTVFDSSSVVDSIILTGEISKSKYSYSYDSNWNVLVLKDEIFADNHWGNFIKISFFYNDDGLLLDKKIEFWNGVQWELTSQHYYSYDENNFLIQTIIESPDGNHQRYNYSNNADGNMTSFVLEEWKNDEWSNLKKELYTYYENKKIRTHTKQYWENSMWNNSSKKEYLYSYNLNDKLDTLLINYFSGPFLNLRFSIRISYSYGSNLNLETAKEDVKVGNYWENSSRKTFTYDSNHNLITEISEVWEEDYQTQDTSWVYHTRDIYTYDNNNDMILGEHEVWEGTYWAKRDCFAELKFYDSFGRFYSFPWMQIEVFYSKTITSITDGDDYPNSFVLFQNYPNPFNPQTVISYSIPKNEIVQLKIFDVLGNEVLTLVDEEQSAGSYNVSLDASNLSSGVYFYRFQSGDFVDTKKMILLH